MTDRWEAFTEKECAVIAVSLAGNIMLMVGTQQPREMIIAMTDDAMALMDSMRERMDIEGLDEGQEHLREVLARIRKAPMN